MLYFLLFTFSCISIGYLFYYIFWLIFPTMSISAKYRAVLIFSHLFLLLSFVGSIILMGVVMLYIEFFRHEYQFYKNTVSLTFIYYHAIIFNITMCLFTSCTLYSKIKSYMKIYLLFSFIYMALIGFFGLYLFTTYKNSVTNSFSILQYSNPPAISIIESVFECSQYQESNKCSTKIGRIVDQLSNIFYLVGGAILLLNFLLFILIKIAVNIDIYLQQPIIPKMENKFVGYGSESLRTRRVIPVKTSPDSITVSTISSIDGNDK